MNSEGGSDHPQGAHPPDGVALEQFVEDFAVTMEGSGFPRASGRVCGWLLVCDPPEQTPTEIAAAVHASAGGVNQSLRLLVQFGLIERIGRRGARSGYYRMKPGAWMRIMSAQQADTGRVRALGEHGLSMLADSPASRRERLAEMTDFYAFLDRELPALLERWAESRGMNNEQ